MERRDKPRRGCALHHREAPIRTKSECEAGARSDCPYIHSANAIKRSSSTFTTHAISEIKMENVDNAVNTLCLGKASSLRLHKCGRIFESSFEAQNCLLSVLQELALSGNWESLLIVLFYRNDIDGDPIARILFCFEAHKDAFQDGVLDQLLPWLDQDGMIFNTQYGTEKAHSLPL
jgi:hypothetical protein